MAMKVHQEQAQDFPLVIATVPATDRQRTMAVGVVIVLIAAAILVYALSKNTTGAARLPGRPALTAIVITVACVLAVIVGLTWIVTSKAEYLPKFYNSDVAVQTRLGNQINFALWLWGATA